MAEIVLFVGFLHGWPKSFITNQKTHFADVLVLVTGLAEFILYAGLLFGCNSVLAFCCFKDKETQSICWFVLSF